MLKAAPENDKGGLNETASNQVSSPVQCPGEEALGRHRKDTCRKSAKPDHFDGSIGAAPSQAFTSSSSIVDLWRLAQYEAASGADVLFDKE